MLISHDNVEVIYADVKMIGCVKARKRRHFRPLRNVKDTCAGENQTTS